MVRLGSTECRRERTEGGRRDDRRTLLRRQPGTAEQVDEAVVLSFRGDRLEFRREAVDAKNHADALVHSTEKALAEHGSKVEESERRAIEDAVSDLKEALKGEDAEAIKAKTNTLAQASMKLGEAMYKQQAEADAKKDAAQDDVVDAEFTEVDDDKNNKKSA